VAQRSYFSSSELALSLDKAHWHESELVLSLDKAHWHESELALGVLYEEAVLHMFRVWGLGFTGQELALGVPYEEAVLHMLHLRRRKLVSLQARQPWVTKRLTVDERGVG